METKVWKALGEEWTGWTTGSGHLLLEEVSSESQAHKRGEAQCGNVGHELLLCAELAGSGQGRNRVPWGRSPGEGIGSP